MRDDIPLMARASNRQTDPSLIPNNRYPKSSKLGHVAPPTSPIHQRQYAEAELVVMNARTISDSNNSSDGDTYGPIREDKEPQTRDQHYRSVFVSQICHDSYSECADDRSEYDDEARDDVDHGIQYQRMEHGKTGRRSRERQYRGRDTNYGRSSRDASRGRSSRRSAVDDGDDGSDTEKRATDQPPFLSKNHSSNRKSRYRDLQLHNWYSERFPVLSNSLSTMLSHDTDITDYKSSGDALEFMTSEGSDVRPSTKQRFAYYTILVTSIQLMILMLQLTMCGIAPIDQNLMVGPFPDAYSLWGGRNSYLLLVENEWWRMITPTFLHVGVLHFAVTAFCQLTAIKVFELHWGSGNWIFVYFMSAVGCQACSNLMDSNSIAVGSSGTLMGMYAAKFAQVLTVLSFDTNQEDSASVTRIDHLLSTLLGMLLVSLLGCFTYIDWSGNVGGLLTGFFSGMLVFSFEITHCCPCFLWLVFGFVGMVGSILAPMYFFVEYAEPDSQLGDECQYFRNLFTENYECGCMWDS